MQGCSVTHLMVIITGHAIRVIINQLTTRGPLSSSTVTESETDIPIMIFVRTDYQTDHQLVSPNRCNIKPVPNTNIYTKHRP